MKKVRKDKSMPDKPVGRNATNGTVQGSATTPVPEIIVEGYVIRSTAHLDPSIPDTCAAWQEAEKKSARRLLRGAHAITCADATAYAAVLSLSIQMMGKGRHVLPLSAIERSYLPLSNSSKPQQESREAQREAAK